MNKKLDYYFAKGTELYEKGKFKKALRLLLKAENIETGYASLNIGNIYSDYALYQGQKNRIKSEKWFKKISKSNDCSAMHNLAVLYKESYKYKKAKKWFKKAIKCGENESAYELAKLYLMEGKIKKAIKLLEIFEGDRLKLNISEGGQEDALKLLNKIQKNIS
jgi:TPR repeat protein